MTITAATAQDIKLLTEISKSAFDTDIDAGADEIGGPPDYDSEKWHLGMMEGGHLYKITEGDKTIGGVILFRDSKETGVMYLGRIFIAPAFHRQGYGKKAMLMLETMFADIECWRLDTPVWNTRTNKFYPEIGYTEMARDSESVYFQKTVKH